MEVCVIVDGASKGNGTYCGAGILIVDVEEKEIKHRAGKYLGIGTNNFAEYGAVLFGLEETQKFSEIRKIKKLSVLSDSNLVINQLNGKFTINEKSLAELHDSVKRKVAELESKGVKVVFDFIDRNFTALADEIARDYALLGSKQGTEKKYPFLKELK
jgi:ribonuclease HI